MTRRLAGAILVLAIALTAMAARSGPASARASGMVTAEYSGTQDFTFVYDPKNPDTWQQHGHFQWDEKVTVRPTRGLAVLVGKPELTITGKIVSTYAPPNTNHSCTGDFSARTDIPKDHFPISISLVGDTAAADATVSALIPFTGTYALSTAASGTDCGILVNGSARIGVLPPDPRTDDYILTPLKDIRLADLPWSMPFKVSDYKDPFTDTITNVRSTFTISGSAGGPPKQPPTPGRYRAKANAAQALKATWERSLYPCLTTAAVLPLLGLGPIGQATAAVVLPISGVLCAAYSKTMADEEKTINDPPLRSYDRTATVPVPQAARVSLPSCSRWRGAARTLCQDLETRLPRLLQAARQTQAVAAAIETTISRETGALRANDANAVRQQDRTLSGLDSQFLSTERAESDAGAAVASLLRTAALPLALTRAKSTNAIEAVLGRVNVSRANLASVLGSLLKPHVVDWLRALA